MTKPLPGEIPLPSIPPAALADEITEILSVKDAQIAHLKRQYEASQQILAQARQGNRVRDECLEIAMEALGLHSAPANSTARHALYNIEQRLDAASQRALARVMRKNRVRDECLAIAMEALNWYGRNCSVLLCGKAGETLDKIEARLAQLEPETEERPE